MTYPPRAPKGFYWLEPGEVITEGDRMPLSSSTKIFHKDDLQPWGVTVVIDAFTILRKIPLCLKGYRWVQIGERLLPTDLLKNQSTGKWVRTILAGQILYDCSAKYIYVRKAPLK